MRIILWLILAAILSPGCKPQQNTVSAPPAPSATGDEIQAQKEALNNLVISFYSKGSGANQNAVKAIEDFLEEYSAKRENPVSYSKISWGREGEVDFCISLSGLNQKERKDFVDSVRRLVKQFELIHFNENHPCRQIK